MMKTTPEEQKSDWEGRRRTLLWMAIGILVGGGIGILIDDVETMLILGLLLGFAIGSRGGRSLGLMEYSPEANRRLAISGVIFFTTFFGVFYLLDQDFDQPVKVILALLPSLPALYFAIAMGLAISSLDEFQRRIQLEAIAIGFALSLIASLGYAMLGLAGVEHLSWFFVPLFMVSGWFIGKVWTQWKYR
jgi:hypothetical protein